MEVLVTLVILGILLMTVMPLAQVTVQRNKEAELRMALREIRQALDAYKQAYDEGRIAKQAGLSGYPPSLKTLVDGVADVSQPAMPTLYFLRRIPVDPFHETKASAEAWGLRSYASSASDPQPGQDVYDVYSLSEATGLNGVAYRQW